MKKQLLVAVITFTSAVHASTPVEDAINVSHNKFKACVTQAGTNITAQHNCVEAHATDMQDLAEALAPFQLLPHSLARPSRLASAPGSTFGNSTVSPNVYRLSLGQVNIVMGPVAGGLIRQFEEKFGDDVTNMEGNAELQDAVAKLEEESAGSQAAWQGAHAKPDALATRAVLTNRFATHSLEMTAIAGGISAGLDHAPASSFRPELLSQIVIVGLGTNFFKSLRDEADRFSQCLQFPNLPSYSPDVFPFPSNFDASKVSHRSLYLACITAHQKVLKQFETSIKADPGQKLPHAAIVHAVLQADPPQVAVMMEVLNDPKMNLNPGGDGALNLQDQGFAYSRTAANLLASALAGN